MKNNTERTCSLNQQTKKINKNKNRNRCTTCSNHRPRKNKQTKQMFTYNIIQKYERKEKQNKQALTITKY
jgi:hypothetical protein